MLKQNGGIIGSTKKLFYTDDLKDGTLIGVDKYGNKYFENKRYFVCRSRWVQYNEDVGLNYDGSQIPAEWYGWMHYKTDIPPTVGDKTILTVIYGGHRYQPTTPVEFEEILKFSLSKTLGINEEPHRKSVQILKDCIPQYTVGHNGCVNAIDEIISNDSLPIIVTGASYKGVSVNDCVLNGIRSAENLLAR
ncbi:hypothetical protein QYM36_011973 [Artemia franciscana]|uniref:NADH dehydrogenase [ubiquinone] 1 alpha subcomplex subunit 12 n=1 Tax=Artemia franciscana TaxID=6661 RepID=A0AA88HHY7_ARTSF|nr:hypothetical protein QYM36_011973 [Artemia franciscana]